MISARNRALTVDWMTDIVHYLTVASSCPLLDGATERSKDMDVFFRSVSMLDAYLGAHNGVAPDRLKVVACACLMLSYKLQCVHPPSVSDVARAAKAKEADIIAEEPTILAATYGELCAPTFAEHLRRMEREGRLRDEALERALLLCERSLLHDASQTDAVAERCLTLARQSHLSYPDDMHLDCDAAYTRRGMSAPPHRSSRKRRFA